MFYALTFPQFDTAPETYEHHLLDIETLNRYGNEGRYEVTALSFHAYAYVANRYRLLPHGASFGDGYGPLLVAKNYTPAVGVDPYTSARQWMKGKTIAVPGTWTSAFLSLHLFAADRTGAPNEPKLAGTQPNFKTVVVPFDEIMPAVAAGKFDCGLIIHEGQLTYHEQISGKLCKVADMGEWWKQQTGLPLPLGGNGIRKDLGEERIKNISKHLRQSIQWGLDHRDQALGYALKYARDMGKDTADKFVGMYVNDYTLGYGDKGREAVRRFLAAGRNAGLITVDVEPDWCE